MTEDERDFLAQIALGWFMVRSDAGTIWRTVQFHGNRHGGPATMTRLVPTRAERSFSAKDGYLRVMFHSNGRRRRVAAHRIVWMLHNSRMVPAGMELNHKNGDKQDNRADNLEVVTRSQNVTHAIRVLGRTRKSRPGEANPAAKVSGEQVAQIRQLWGGRAMSQREIGQMFGLTQSAVSAIVRQKSWQVAPPLTG